MIPARPWKVTALRPDDAWVYVVDASGEAVIDAALPRELATFIVQAINERERCALCGSVHPLGRCVG